MSTTMEHVKIELQRCQMATEALAGNPFVHEADVYGIRGAEAVWLVLAAPLVIVRLILYLLTLLMLILTFKIHVGFFGSGDPEKPMFPSPLLQALRNFTRVFPRLWLWSWGFTWIKREGTPVEASEAPILICNHSTLVDGPGLYMDSPKFPAVVAKASLSSAVTDPVLYGLQTIFVDRLDPDSRSKTAAALRDRSMDTMDGACWPSTLIFPEATTVRACGPGRGVLEFKQGPFLPMVPVQVAAYDFSRTKAPFGWVAYNHLPTWLVIWRQFAYPYHPMTLKFSQVLTPLEGETVPEFSDRCRAEMCRLLGTPALHLGVEDEFVAEAIVARGLVPRKEDLPMILTMRQTLGSSSAGAPSFLPPREWVRGVMDVWAGVMGGPSLSKKDIASNTNDPSIPLNAWGTDIGCIFGSSIPNKLRERWTGMSEKNMAKGDYGFTWDLQKRCSAPVSSEMREAAFKGLQELFEGEDATKVGFAAFLWCSIAVACPEGEMEGFSSSPPDCLLRFCATMK